MVAQKGNNRFLQTSLFSIAICPNYLPIFSEQAVMRFVFRVNMSILGHSRTLPRAKILCFENLYANPCGMLPVQENLSLLLPDCADNLCPTPAIFQNAAAIRWFWAFWASEPSRISGFCRFCRALARFQNRPLPLVRPKPPRSRWYGGLRTSTLPPK